MKLCLWFRDSHYVLIDIMRQLRARSRAVTIASDHEAMCAAAKKEFVSNIKEFTIIVKK